MHQTISGVTLNKTKVVDRKAVEDFVDNTHEDFKKIESGENCLYSNMDLVSDNALNYLNVFSEKASDNQLKFIIRNEFDKLEKIYPYMGDVFIDEYFNKSLDNIKNLDTFKFSKDEVSLFLESLEYDTNRSICKKLFQEASLEYSISVETYKGSNVVIKKLKDMHFNLDYDFSFLGNKSSHSMTNYKFIIIDGMIESVGEIHHLLFEASQNKMPYVIFCFGVSPEVKHVIIENNKKGITEVFPVCLTFDENTINILNDIALLHKSEVVSSQKGQTISQEVRKKLKTGKTIILNRSGFILNPVAQDSDIVIHKRYLEKRASSAQNQHNQAAIVKRIKRLSNKSIKIYIPESIKSSTKFIRELDYILRFFKSMNHKMIYFKKNDNNSFYFMPYACIELISKCVESIETTYKNIHKLILNFGE
jgi:hypothetical protein